MGFPLFWCLWVITPLLTYKTRVLLELQILWHVSLDWSLELSWFFMFLLFSLTFLLRFISKRKHLLATLLRLEGLILIIFCIGLSVNRFLIEISSFMLGLLSLIACEGALGLSLLVSIIRSYGSDTFNSLNLLQC